MGGTSSVRDPRPSSTEDVTITPVNLHLKECKIL